MRKIQHFETAPIRARAFVSIKSPFGAIVLQYIVGEFSLKFSPVWKNVGARYNGHHPHLKNSPGGRETRPTPAPPPGWIN